MDISPLVPKGRQLITGYGEGGFKINNEFISGPLIVCAERSVQWSIGGDRPFTQENLQPALGMMQGAELILLGTGKAMIPVDPQLRAWLKSMRISVDAMDTGAACRTYNVLLSEERRVVAALLPV